ncbi:F-box and associated interaction domains-containing protein [Euphorbia peplus]|nr:F-box and associated interaction domains-containing protein [Euphorbia peplus]
MARILPQLPLEIIIDILSRLPVKPLFRLKCVCKSWLSLISNNPEFAKIHLRYATQDTTINRYKLFLSTYPFQSIDHDDYCYGDNVVKRELRYPNPATETADDLEFIGSCNGLIAIAVNSNSNYITVWNPTTGDSRELPASTSSISGDQVFSGFGYDSHLDDYKVVRGVTYPSGGDVKMEVFNLKSDRWRSIEDLHSNIFLNSSSISINGFMHWLVPLENDPNPKLGIISFDLANEKFLEMVSVPDHVTQKLGSNSLRIQRVGENVCVCSNWYGDCYEAWIMKRDGREILWSKWYSFGSDQLPGCKYWVEVIWVAKNGKVLFDWDGRELVVYSPEDQSSSSYDMNWDGFQGITYIETLVSPNST